MIAYLVNHYPYVSHTFIRTEILELERQGVPVRRIAMRGWNSIPSDAVDTLEMERTRYILKGGALPLAMSLLVIALTRPHRFTKVLFGLVSLSRKAAKGFFYHLIYLAEACLVLRWLKEEPVTHVHAHFGSNATTVALLVRRLGGPDFSFTVHGPEEFDKFGPLKVAVKVHESAFVVAISSFGRSQLFRWINRKDWPKVRIVHCSLDQKFMDQTAEVHALSKDQIVCVGRLCEQKGQLILIEALSLLKDRDVYVSAVLAGDGEMRGDVEQAIKQHDLDDLVRITGWISPDEVRKILAASRALVLPSFAEGLPVAIMESMAMERLVISTTVAGIPELVRDGVDGHLVAASDAAGLANAIEKILNVENSELAMRGEAAKGRVMERHSSAQEVAKLKRLFVAADTPVTI